MLHAHLSECADTVTGDENEMKECLVGKVASLQSIAAGGSRLPSVKRFSRMFLIVLRYLAECTCYSSIQANADRFTWAPHAARTEVRRR